MSELSAILLAAGGSSRLGRAKQLLEFRGATLVHRAARLLTECIDNVTVVTGARAIQVGVEMQGLSVAMTHNERWREGVGGSIALAMRNLAPDSGAVLVTLCDQYLLERRDLEALIAAWAEDKGCIAAARWGEAFGPPVIFPHRFFPQLSRLHGDMGARQILVGQRARVRFIDMPNAAFDVDTEEDLRRLQRADAKNP